MHCTHNIAFWMAIYTVFKFILCIMVIMVLLFEIIFKIIWQYSRLVMYIYTNQLITNYILCTVSVSENDSMRLNKQWSLIKLILICSAWQEPGYWIIAFLTDSQSMLEQGKNIASIFKSLWHDDVWQNTVINQISHCQGHWLYYYVKLYVSGRDFIPVNKAIRTLLHRHKYGWER